MCRQARIVDLRELGAFGAPIRDAHRVLVLPLHADFEGLQAALQQPASKGIGRLTPNHHLATDFVDERLVAADDTREKVVMTIQKFRRRVNNRVRAMLDRAEVDWTGERRIHYQSDALRVSEALQRVELEDSTSRIDRRLEENHTRILFQRFPPGARLERV